jgi:photosystem II stability/assembly factor-like uncharacterized protein
VNRPTLLSRALAVACVVPGALVAQQRPAGSSVPRQNSAGPQVAVPVDTALWGSLQWRNIGPNSAGRMAAVAGSSARPGEYYFGTTGGGVWKTTDGGTTLTPVTDKYFGGTIGAIAVSESNPDIVYVGGGESPIRGNVSHGEGVWKTTDAGKTWSYLGLRETQQIARVRVHPTNPDIVYVGALGHVWGPNPERGVFKTTDGGRTWRKVLFRNDSTGISDLVMDPTNPEVLYAAFWQAGRKPWLLISGGAGSGIFKTTDGGEHWTEITHNPGLPSGVLGRIGVAVSPVKSNLVWALIEHEPNGGIYRSADGGATWTFMNGDRDLRQRAWYYSNIYADPKDTNVLAAPNVGPMWSKDGGKTFARGFGGGDNHDVWIAPDDPKRIAVAHDNGAIITTDGGASSIRVAAPTGQFYHVHLTNHVPYHVCGAKQDAGSSCGPVRAPGGFGRGGGGGGRGGRGGSTSGPQYSDFYGVAGGESGYIASDPLDPEITYGGNYSGVLEMQNRRTGLSERLDPWPLNPMGHDAKDSKYRFQWTYPIMNSPHDPHVLYVGSNVLFKSSNDGKTWSVISPDLTRHDPATLGPSGGPITKDQTSIEYYATIFAVHESPVTAGLIWTGSDDGLIYLTRDGGKSWKNVTPIGLPEWTRISIIDPSPHDPATAYVAANRYQLDDFAPYLYKTHDYGATWTKITDGITPTEFTRAVREDLVRPGLLYAATERGVWVSYNDGRNWQSLQRNLPPVPVHDIALRDDDMVIATHGRAFWVMENLTELRQAPEVAAAQGKNFLYKPAPVTRAGNASTTVMYRLAQDNQPVTVEFLDPTGKLVRKYSSTDSVPQGGGGRGGGGRSGGAGAARVTTRLGVNQYQWNMRYPDASSFQGMIFWAGGVTGPSIAPGTYTVRLTVGDAAPLSAPLVVRRDPRASATDADLAEQTRFALQLRDRVTEANDAVKRIRSVKRQLDERKPKMAAVAAFAPLATTFADSLSAVEDSIYQTRNKSGEDPLNYPVRVNNQLAALIGFVSNGERRPPAQAYEVFNTLSPKLDRELARYKKSVDAFLGRLNAMLKAAGLPEIVPTTDEPPPQRTNAVSDHLPAARG